MKYDVGLQGIRHRKDVKLSRPGRYTMNLDEWHAECVADSVGEVQSFLAQRGSAEVAGETCDLFWGSRVHENHGTDDASDIVIIPVDVGVGQRMSKANVGIGWVLDNTDRLSCNKAD
jgi:hypothetical protein